MTKKLLGSIGIIVLLVIIGVWIYKSGNQPVDPQEQNSNTLEFQEPQAVDKSVDAENPEAESDQESFKNKPGLINSVSKTDLDWTLTVDLLTLNEGSFLDNPNKIVNQNPKIRNLKVTVATKAYACGGSEFGTMHEISAEEFIGQMQKILQRNESDIWSNMATFDITGDTITALYPRPAGCVS